MKFVQKLHEVIKNDTYEVQLLPDRLGSYSIYTVGFKAPNLKGILSLQDRVYGETYKSQIYARYVYNDLMERTRELFELHPEEKAHFIEQLSKFTCTRTTVEDMMREIKVILKEFYYINVKITREYEKLYIQFADDNSVVPEVGREIDIEVQANAYNHRLNVIQDVALEVRERYPTASGMQMFITPQAADNIPIGLNFGVGTRK